MQITRSSAHQRAVFELKDGSRTVAMGTLEGVGENSAMKLEANPSQNTWSFGPFQESLTLYITIDHSQSGTSFQPSVVLKPITVFTTITPTNNGVTEQRRACAGGEVA